MAVNQTPVQGGRMATLDLLRLVAALAVVGFHYLFRGELAPEGHNQAFPAVSAFAIYGYLGVNLFFLISGFVIAWSAEGRDFARFSLARFARLYPGFIFCLTITFAVLFMAGDPFFQVSAIQFLANLVMFSPAFGQPFMDGVYWSIVLEIIFYGWVALALFFGVFERWKTGLLTGWLFACAVNEYWLGSETLRLVLLTEYGPLFVSGVLLHHMHAHGRSAEALALLAASFVMSTAAMSSMRDWMFEQYGQAVPLIGLVVSNVAIYGILMLAIRFSRHLASTPLVLMLGGLTYPLYLLHQNIGYILIEAAAGFMGAWGAVSVVTLFMLVLSWFVWRFVEGPARRTINQLMMPIADKISRRCAPPAYPLPAE